MITMLQELRPVPKPQHARKSKKRKARGEFSAATRKLIMERDGGLCVRCGAKAVHIHHVIYRSQGGLGTVDNGVSVCERCHSFAHESRQGRVFFEIYRESHLLKGEAE